MVSCAESSVRAGVSPRIPGKLGAWEEVRGRKSGTDALTKPRPSRFTHPYRAWLRTRLAAGHDHLARAHHFRDAVLVEHHLRRVELVGPAGDLKHEGVFGEIN